MTDLKFSPDYETLVCGGKFVSCYENNLNLMGFSRKKIVVIVEGYPPGIPVDFIMNDHPGLSIFLHLLPRKSTLFLKFWRTPWIQTTFILHPSPLNYPLISSTGGYIFFSGKAQFTKKNK